MFATRARKGVENARLSLDASKGKKGGGRGMNPDLEMVSEEMRREVEQKEDEFVTQTEEAVGVMQNVSLSLHGFWQGMGWGKGLIRWRCRFLIRRSRCATWQI